jgi:CDP-diacylglycerol--serine O-phosphatidyltransferase
VLAYTILIGVMMVSIIPTYSGKLLGERIVRDWVLPIFILAMTLVACLVTYPYATLTIATLLYLAAIPMTWKRFRKLEQLNAATAGGGAPQPAPAASRPSEASPAAPDDAEARAQDASKRGPIGEGARVVEIRPGEQKR